MKGSLIFVLFSLIFITACKEQKSFQVGDCIQKPDSVIVWKIKAINDDNYTLHQKQDQREPDIKTIKLEGVWTKSNCPSF